MLKTYPKEEIQELSFVEIAYLILKEEKKPLPFSQVLEIAMGYKDLTDEELQDKLAQFYTDLNVDGRFVCIGDNQWGLKVWYPVESSEEELATTVKPKKRKKKKDIEDGFDDYDDEDIDEDFDDLDELDEIDDLDEEEDFDEDLDEEEDDYDADFDDAEDDAEDVEADDLDDDEELEEEGYEEDFDIDEED